MAYKAVVHAKRVKKKWRAEVAQSVEQGTENPRVGSSILSLGTIKEKLQNYFSEAFSFGSGYFRMLSLKRSVLTPKRSV